MYDKKNMLSKLVRFFKVFAGCERRRLKTRVFAGLQPEHTDRLLAFQNPLIL